MYIVIGKIEVMDGNRKKLDACRIIDSNTKEVKDIHITRVRNAIRNGTKVIGFKSLSNLTATKNEVKVRQEIIRDGAGKFRWSKVPRLTGAGNLVDEADAKYLIVFGWSGLAEVKKYHMFDWKGKEVIIDVEEFIQKVQANEINGALFNHKHCKPMIERELNREII